MQLFTINATCEQVKYTITQNKQNHKIYAREVAKILSQHKIDGFTIEVCYGYWQGTPEKSYKITIAHDCQATIDNVCESLRDRFLQDAVMITYPDNSVKFI